MGVALDVLVGDLRHWHPDMRMADRSLSGNIRYCVPADGQALDAADALYVLRSGEASSAFSAVSDPVNMLIVGPRSAYGDLPHGSNVVAIDTDESAYAVVMRECANLIARYAEGYLRVSELAGKNAPLERVASSCAEVLGKPLLVWSLIQHGVLFSSADDPLAFSLARCGSVLSDAVKDAAVHTKGSFVLKPEDLGLSDEQPMLLCRCVFVEAEPVAALIVECGVGYQVGRDGAVLGSIASFVQGCFDHGSSGDCVQPSGLVNQVESLLNRSVTSWQLLESSLSEYGWKLLDEYLCLVARSGAETPLSINFLSSGLSAMGDSPAAVCVSHGAELVFVVNMSRAHMDRDEVASRIAFECQRHHPNCVLGVSLPFSELQDLYFYGQQAEKALELGQLLDPEEKTCLFEDYYLDFIASCCLEVTSATALFPAGYNRLRNYGKARERGSDLSAFLDHYVESGFQMKKTISSEYCSRTTAFAKLKRIKEITGMDLDDASVRVALMIATRAIKLSKLRPR